MTFLLQTTDQKEIHAGFFANHMEFIQFGDHLLSTRHFCEFNSYISQSPKRNFAELRCFDCSNLGNVIATNQISKLRDILEVEKSINSSLNEFQREQILSKGYVDDGIGPVPEIQDDKLVIPVNIYDGGNCISFDKYLIDKNEYRIFALRIAHGGLFGWPANLPKPEYAISAEENIRNTKHPIFK